MASCETKNGTKVTMHTPPLTGSRRSTSSGTLRGLSQTARALEWEKITGAADASRAACMVPAETCDRSTSMPSRFISATTERPKSDRPPVSTTSVAESAQPDVGVVGERHVADAEREQRPEHAERPPDRVAALRAEQRGDLARLERRVDVGRGQRELESGRVSVDHPVHEVDLLEHGGHGGVARQRRPGRRPTRTGRRPRPRPAAVCRCGCSAPAGSGRPRPGRSRTVRAVPRAGRCARR